MNVAPPPVRLGVLISGEGTNLQAIIDAIANGDLRADIRLVISNKAAAGGLERARRHGIPAMTIDHRVYANRCDFDHALVAALQSRDVELVVCAGFMRLLSPVMIDAFRGRIMNIHPALCPAFPGVNAVRQALAYGARFTGCTVFFVTEGVDDGPIIVQAVVPILPDDDEAALAARIHAEEHRIYPLAIRLYQEKRLEIDGRIVRIRGYENLTASGTLVNPRLD
ncbi:phosphoribosylglycinamide formyltransferase [bacterium]|nr:phosphoribosylglycinamide formyltransferase [bacterium]